MSAKKAATVLDKSMSEPEDLPAYVLGLQMTNGVLRLELAKTRRLALRLADEAEATHVCRGDLCLLCGIVSEARRVATTRF
jgi:hypothetical protein